MGRSEFVDVDGPSSARQLVRSLSSREIDVLREIASGASSMSIARDLGIGAQAVEIHRIQLMRKLKAGVTADAVRIAICAVLA